MKVCDLIGSDLDYWAAQANNMRYTQIRNGRCFAWKTSNRTAAKPYSPSTNWEQAGPIIEREKMSTQFTSASMWRVCVEWIDEPTYEGFGATPLIAAMRCFVASKFGEEVGQQGG